MAAKFVLKKGSTGKFRFNLVATNGQVITTSEAYESKTSAINGIESVKRNAPTLRSTTRPTSSRLVCSILHRTCHARPTDPVPGRRGPEGRWRPRPDRTLGLCWVRGAPGHRATSGHQRSPAAKRPPGRLAASSSSSNRAS
jgi:uncharacterized protein YegP (UPF0339 family)